MYYSTISGFTSEKVSEDQVYVYDTDYQKIQQDLQNGAYIELNDAGYPITKFRPLYYSTATGFSLTRLNDSQIEITYDYWSELITGQANGKVITEDEKGYPVLADPPPPTPLTHEEEVALANKKKTYLLAQATVAINPLQDAVDLDDATDEEVALLKKWKQFRVAVNRVDTELAPDITWPVPPVEIPEQNAARGSTETDSELA